MKSVLNVREAADYLGLSKSTLDKWRGAGGRGLGPQFLRLGKRRIVYAVKDLDAWLAGQRHSSTAEYATSTPANPL